MNKKLYSKPAMEEIILDNIISLQMGKSGESPCIDHPHAVDGNKGKSSEPFASPFGDKPFN
jgi:hypothetical protein